MMHKQGRLQKDKGDPLRKIVPRPVKKFKHSSLTSEKVHGNQLKDKLRIIEEDEGFHDFSGIHGNTYRCIIYYPADVFPSIGQELPSPIFVKLYNRLNLAKEHFSRQSYYDMFINEYEINEILSESRFASCYARLIMSGYWNGLASHPMHMFEYLGEEKLIEEWDHNRVYHNVESRLEEIHLMEISHNYIRIDNIHVSSKGRTTLIDFGLAIYPCSEENKKDDIETLNRLFSASRGQ